MNISQMIRAERLGDKTLARRAREAGFPVTNITIRRWREDDTLPVEKRKSSLSRDVMLGLAAAVQTHPAVVWAGFLEGQQMVASGFSEGIRACMLELESNPDTALASPLLLGPEVGTEDQRTRTRRQVTAIITGHMTVPCPPQFSPPTALPGLCRES